MSQLLFSKYDTISVRLEIILRMLVNDKARYDGSTCVCCAAEGLSDAHVIGLSSSYRESGTTESDGESYL